MHDQMYGTASDNHVMYFVVESWATNISVRSRTLDDVVWTPTSWRGGKMNLGKCVQVQELTTQVA